jgi:hypothetical protein
MTAIHDQRLLSKLWRPKPRLAMTPTELVRAIHSFRKAWEKVTGRNHGLPTLAALKSLSVPHLKKHVNWFYSAKCKKMAEGWVQQIRKAQDLPRQLKRIHAKESRISLPLPARLAAPPKSALLSAKHVEKLRAALKQGCTPGERNRKMCFREDELVRQPLGFSWYPYVIKPGQATRTTLKTSTLTRTLNMAERSATSGSPWWIVNRNLRSWLDKKERHLDL